MDVFEPRSNMISGVKGSILAAELKIGLLEVGMVVERSKESLWKLVQ